jgi:hypothetical protein
VSLAFIFLTHIKWKQYHFLAGSYAVLPCATIAIYLDFSSIPLTCN